ncbi:hypothetical protein M2373_002870 [Chryseobacterium sp. JUb7]|nr:hypothetical protein [Chryseobacterium sp. JUb7]
MLEYFQASAKKNLIFNDHKEVMSEFKTWIKENSK